MLMVSWLQLKLTHDNLIFFPSALIDCNPWQWFELLQKKSEKEGSEKSGHVGAWK
jgi:hypothetical protein